MNLVRILLAMLFVTGAQAQTTAPDRLNYPFFPDFVNLVSENDTLYVIYRNWCGDELMLDDTIPARQFIENGVHVVELIVVPSDLVCFSAGPQSTTHYYPVEALPMGWHEVERRILLRSTSGGSAELLHAHVASIRIADTPNIGISGAWFDPEQPGTGFFISLLPTASNTERPLAIVYWATLDEQQRPAWFSGAGKFSASRLQIDMAEGGSAGGTVSLTFEYLGCGRAQIIDGRFPNVVTALSQLTEVKGLKPCAAERQPDGFFNVVH